MTRTVKIASDEGKQLDLLPGGTPEEAKEIVDEQQESGQIDVVKGTGYITIFAPATDKHIVPIRYPLVALSRNAKIFAHFKNSC